MAKTSAEILIERLIEWGVDTVFGHPGDGINGIFEALRTHQEKIRFIQVRHEEAGALAACGYAKFTGRLGVCLATSGPGGIHLLNGLYDANMDGQPVLAITGHTFHSRIGTHYQQDVDLDRLFSDVAAYSERVMGPDHVASVVDEAIKTAMARRTVAHINIPKDIQDWTSSDVPRPTGNVAEHSADLYSSYAANPLPSEDLLMQAADVINKGDKVAILVGHGCADARAEVLRLAELAGAPIVKALLGKDVVPDGSPYSMGAIGLLGTSASVDAMQECDTLVIAGSSFPYLEFYPQPGKAKVVQIDMDATRIGLRTPVDVGIIGDCKQVLQALLPLVKPKKDRTFLEESQENMKKWRRLMKEQGTRTDRPMKPQVVAYEVNKLLTDDAIVVSDTGTVTTWAARFVDARDRMKFSASGLLATMGNGLPYAVAAALAYPGRQVVCLSGDGGFTMLMGEVATLVKYKLPVKVVVLSNNALGMIKWEQIVLEANPQFGVELQPIDFAAFARACGAGGYTIEDPKKASSQLAEAFSQPGPVVINAQVDPHEPPWPGKITTEQALHFAQALLKGQTDRMEIIKTVIEDKVREVV
jgi:pyruvate dehydrogenase (quinone)